MKTLNTVITASLLALSIGNAFAAGSPGVETQTQGFLNALAQGGGKPLEQLSVADARAVLVGAQQGATLPAADVSEKTIKVDGQSIKLVIVKPQGPKGTLPAFMFFHGGGFFGGTLDTVENPCKLLAEKANALVVSVDVDIKDGKLREGITLPLGPLRLMDLSGGSIDKAREIVDEAFAAMTLAEVGERVRHRVAETAVVWRQGFRPWAFAPLAARLMVGATPRGVRLSRRVASSLSSRVICWLRADCTMSRSAAARLIEPSSTMRTK